ncbi:MAG: trypsin-like peptidase domain-containing protein [Bacteroidales bacterium]|nr:trypsin-like peptidase domain-containing protein [Bacteroidales bacterium]
MKKLFCTLCNVAFAAMSLTILTSCNQADGIRPDVATQVPHTTPVTHTAQLKYVDFSQVAEQTIDAVVHIKTEMTKLTPLYETFFGMIIDRGVQRKTYNAFGSGVIISPDGYIVTNNHVVQDAERISVTLNDKRTLPAQLIGHDPATDLALIKIETDGLQWIPFGNSDSVRIGEPVLAIGNPFNLTSTVTAGIISAKARNVGIIENTRGLESPIESFLQTDAAVNSGNSGGALVNGDAQLIGIITAIASGNGYYTGYSFAIPSDLAQKVVGDLKQYGYTQRAYLGVNVTEMTEELAAQLGTRELKGMVITRIIADCAADRAGLHVGDILMEVAGVDIHSYAEMMEVLGKCSPGDKVEVVYQRNGQPKTTTVTLLNAMGNTQILRR